MLFSICKIVNKLLIRQNKQKKNYQNGTQNEALKLYIFYYFSRPHW